MFYRVFWTALLAGAIAGVCLFAAHLAITTPLILQAEVFEGPTPIVAQNVVPALDVLFGDLERNALSLVADLITSMAFSFLLVGAIALSGRDIDWQQGLVWGLCGYASFALAPAFGMAPELPGMYSTNLEARQVWWAATALATAMGLAFVILSERHAWKWAGPILIVLPHLFGTPEHETFSGDVPAALASEFAIATLVVGGLYWIFLGSLAGYFFQRFDAD